MSVQTLNAVEFIGKLAQDRNLFIVDLRTHAEVEAECLGNCLHLPLQELSEEHLKARMQEKGIDVKTPVYLLCQSGKRAAMAVTKLEKSEGISLVVLEGGLNAIKQQGVTTIIGTRKVISLERQVRIAAGILILLGVTLGFTVHAGFFLLSGFVGAGLTFAGVTDTCGMAMGLAYMPWNNKTK